MPLLIGKFNPLSYCFSKCLESFSQIAFPQSFQYAHILYMINFFLVCHLTSSSFLFSVYLSIITSVVALEIVVINLLTIMQCSLSYYQQFNSYCDSIYCVIASSGLKYFLLGAHKTYQRTHETSKINKPPHSPCIKGLYAVNNCYGKWDLSVMQGTLVEQLLWGGLKWCGRHRLSVSAHRSCSSK